MNFGIQTEMERLVIWNISAFAIDS